MQVKRILFFWQLKCKNHGFVAQILNLGDDGVIDNGLELFGNNTLYWREWRPNRAHGFAARA